MSGSRDYLTDKLKRELASAFALLLKNVKHTPVDLTLNVLDTIYPTGIRTTVCWRNCDMATPAVAGGLNVLAVTPPPSKSLSLLPPEATLVSGDCDWHVETRNVPMFAGPNNAHSHAQGSASCAVHEVTFDGIHSITRRPAKKLTFSTLEAPCAKGVWSIPVSRTQVSALDLRPVQVLKKTYGMPVHTFHCQKKVFPSKYWILPMKRAPIPPHRFTTEQKKQFRQALAEKSGALSVDIQLQVVFDRMNIALFSSMDQDDRGNLICYPKAELVGSALLSKPNRRELLLAPMYLVFGMRTDTQEGVRALVPMTPPPEVAMEEGGSHGT